MCVFSCLGFLYCGLNFRVYETRNHCQTIVFGYLISWRNIGFVAQTEYVLLSLYILCMYFLYVCIYIIGFGNFKSENSSSKPLIIFVFVSRVRSGIYIRSRAPYFNISDIGTIISNNRMWINEIKTDDLVHTNIVWQKYDLSLNPRLDSMLSRFSIARGCGFKGPGCEHRFWKICHLSLANQITSIEID